MTPKEKANHLFKKYLNEAPANKTIDFHSDIMAIRCALIAVDEIINTCEYNRVESYNTDWWEKVKIEINKL